MNELGNTVEVELGPDPVDECDIDDLAIKVARKIEQEYFEQDDAEVEHGTSSEARHAVIAPPAKAYAYRVNAVLESARRIDTKIGGGVTELASTLVPMHHFCADEPGVTEKLARFDHPSGAKGGADRAGTDWSAGVLEPRHDINGKAELRALGGDIVG